MDEEKYIKKLTEKDETFEAECLRCGKCCGLQDDPCRELRKREDGAYFCVDYAHRIGRHETVSGVSFNCVDIREHIGGHSLRQDCGYRKASKRIRTERS